MLRLTVLLCAAIFVTLLIAGEDKGQMRPGLATAVAQGEDIVVLQPRRTSMPIVTMTPVPEVMPVVAEAPARSDVVVETAVLAAEPPPPPSGRKVTPAPVFTLSSLPTVAVDTTASDPVATEVLANGDVWYVTARSVNVRQGPSTETSIVDKLSLGEAVTVAFEEGSEWARVSIEGDGLEGYVALRFLSPEAP